MNYIIRCIKRGQRKTGVSDKVILMYELSKRERYAFFIFVEAPPALKEATTYFSKVLSFKIRNPSNRT